MRTVTLQFNFRATPDINWSVKTEVLVDETTDAEEAGRSAADFIFQFQSGMTQGMIDYGSSDEEE